MINELDLLRCDLTAYTPVLLEHSGHVNAFIAVPDSGIRIGHVMLHEIGEVFIAKCFYREYSRCIIGYYSLKHCQVLLSLYFFMTYLDQ